MTALRNLSPLSSTAAILPNYKLRFNVKGISGIEPSAAAIECCLDGTIDNKNDNNHRVHGILYELTEEDFARVGSTEGVPFGYRWHECKVYPYVGDCMLAGEQVLRANRWPSSPTSDVGGGGAFAYTLLAGRPTLNDIPPSKSYQNLLVEGAKLWKMDGDYVQMLEEVPYATNLLFKDGLAKTLVRVAQARKRWL